MKEEADKEGKSLAPVTDFATKLGQEVAFILWKATRGALNCGYQCFGRWTSSPLLKTLVSKDVDGKKESKTTKSLVNTGFTLMVSSLTMHLVLHTVHTHQTLVSQQT